MTINNETRIIQKHNVDLSRTKLAEKNVKWERKKKKNPISDSHLFVGVQRRRIDHRATHGGEGETNEKTKAHLRRRKETLDDG